MTGHHSSTHIAAGHTAKLQPPRHTPHTLKTEFTTHIPDKIHRPQPTFPPPRSHPSATTSHPTYHISPAPTSAPISTHHLTPFHIPLNTYTSIIYAPIYTCTYHLYPVYLSYTRSISIPDTTIIYTSQYPSTSKPITIPSIPKIHNPTPSQLKFSVIFTHLNAHFAPFECPFRPICLKKCKKAH